MTVRCKFKLNSVTRKLGQKYTQPGGPNTPAVYVGVEHYDAKFSAVYSSDTESENKKFWDATPSGVFEVTTINAMPWELGKEYYIDISEA